MLSCQASQEALPRSLHSPEGEAEELMRRAIELVAGGAAPYLYINQGGGQDGKTEPQWTQIDSLGTGQYRSLEVYNVFDNPGGDSREFFLLTFVVDLRDTSRRYPVQDIRFRATADTAYFTDVNPQELKLLDPEPVLRQGGLPVYAFDGFAHAGDLEPGFLRFWSPRAGSVLSWYGRAETFELMATGHPAWDAALPGLRAALRGHLGLSER
ncbi:MAG: hypothetical protein D6722_22760 [Bacteroidetes bacterium]|nr:MAG: hypothetical protein D6722_22760 [Bacteroidota bacterium]